MAIEKTVFTGTTQAAQSPEVLAWLQANGTDYFDTIEADENGNISCKVRDKTAVQLGFDGTKKSIITNLANGTEVSCYTNAALMTYGVVTTYGMIMKFSYGASNVLWLMITKSDSEGLIISSVYNTAAGSNIHLYAGDFDNSASWSDYFGSNTLSNLNEKTSTSAAMTALTPLVVLDVPSFAPNLFRMTFSEYVGVEGKLLINGEEYFSTGYFALKG